MATIYVPDDTLYELATAARNLSTGTYKALLVDPAYTPAASDTYISAASAHEVSGSGYTGGFAGGSRITLTTLTVTKDTTNHVALWIFDPISWGSINVGTARYFSIYQPNTTDANSRHICTVQFTTDQITVGGPFVYTPPATGVLRLRVV